MHHSDQEAHRAPWAVLSLGLLLLVAPEIWAGGSDQDFELARLDWMVGAWMKSDGTRSAEEHWLPARGGLMLGLHRDVLSADRAIFEYLRIERRPDGIFYLASPAGRAPTAFKLIKLNGSRAVFSNPEHDFPQRIIYWVNGKTLYARIEGEQNGKPASQEFFWPRVEGP